MKLNDIVKNKPRMDECRVFKIDVGATPPDDIPELVASVKASFAQDFDISHVIFVPVRGNESATGWQ